MSERILDTGFASIQLNYGPDTLRVTVRRKEDGREIIFCLTELECEILAQELTAYGYWNH
jgi:hypothetical protein